MCLNLYHSPIEKFQSPRSIIVWELLVLSSYNRRKNRPILLNHPNMRVPTVPITWITVPDDNWLFKAISLFDEVWIQPPHSVKPILLSLSHHLDMFVWRYMIRGERDYITWYRYWPIAHSENPLRITFFRSEMSNNCFIHPSLCPFDSAGQTCKGMMIKMRWQPNLTHHPPALHTLHQPRILRGSADQPQAALNEMNVIKFYMTKGCDRSRRRRRPKGNIASLLGLGCRICRGSGPYTYCIMFGFIFRLS